MAIRADTYALALPIEHLLERGAAQTLSAPIRHGSSGAVVAVTSGTLAITRADGTAFLAASAVTVGSDGIATYAITAPAATETLGDGWTATWVLTIAGEVYTYRHGAILCAYVPRCPVSVADVLGRVPSLSGREPQTQGSRGSGVGWQLQIDGAYYEFLRELRSAARPIWRLKSALDYHDRILVRACQLCVQAISTGPEGAFDSLSKQLYFDSTKANSAVKLTYDDDVTGVRRGASPTTRLAPTGRPQW